MGLGIEASFLQGAYASSLVLFGFGLRVLGFCLGLFRLSVSMRPQSLNPVEP